MLEIKLDIKNLESIETFPEKTRKAYASSLGYIADQIKKGNTVREIKDTENKISGKWAINNIGQKKL